MQGVILRSLIDRDKRERDPFESFFSAYNSLLDQHQALKKEFIVAASERDTLLTKAQFSGSCTESPVKNLELETKINMLQKENLDYARKVIEATQLANKAKEKEEDMKRMAVQIQALRERNKALDVEKKTLLDEQAASQSLIDSLQKECRSKSETINQMSVRLNQIQQELLIYKNAEHDLKYRRECENKRFELAEAATQLIDLDDPNIADGFAMVGPYSNLPEYSIQVIAGANDQDLTHVKWSPSGKYFATAGVDRRIRLFSSASSQKFEFKQQYMGSNQTVTCVDFDREENLILGSSNDYSCRVWSLEDARLKVNLTGHSEKVISAKFTGQLNKVVSVSADRTLKLWNLDRGMCVKTYITFSGSQDVVVNVDTNQFITGHLDRKVRIWDALSESNTDQIEFPERITGLDISKDYRYVLINCKNSSLYTIDLRMNQILETFSSESYRTVSLNRPCFSPDAVYIAAGGQDGKLYLWKRSDQQLLSRLEGHQREVICCSWRPQGDYVISADKLKTAIIWGV